MNAKSSDLILSNVYEACNDGFTRNRTYKRMEIAESPNHDFKVLSERPLRYEIILDKNADDYDKMYTHTGSFISPDEILQLSNMGNLKIPLKNREEFPPDAQLPDSDLLKALHYYFSDKCDRERKYKFLHGVFDESALLAFGLAVESWVDEAVDENVMQMFLEEENGDVEMEEEMEEENVSADEPPSETTPGSSGSSSDESDTAT